jgi:hypothetical protein
LVHSSPLFLPYLFPFLKYVHRVSMLHIHTWIEHTSTIFTLVYPLHLPSPLTSSLPLTWPIFQSCLSFFKCLIILQWGFCLGILPVNILHLKQSNCLYSSSSPFCSTLYCWIVFSLTVSSSYTDMMHSWVQ